MQGAKPTYLSIDPFRIFLGTKVPPLKRDLVSSKPSITQEIVPTIATPPPFESPPIAVPSSSMLLIWQKEDRIG